MDGTDITGTLSEFRRWLRERPRYAGNLVIEATPQATENLAQAAFVAGVLHGQGNPIGDWPTPPLGWDSWLDYAVHTMDVDGLHADACADEKSATEENAEPWWDNVPRKDVMRQAATAELVALREAVRKGV